MGWGNVGVEREREDERVVCKKGNTSRPSLAYPRNARVV